MSSSDGRVSDSNLESYTVSEPPAAQSSDRLFRECRKEVSVPFRADMEAELGGLEEAEPGV